MTNQENISTKLDVAGNAVLSRTIGIFSYLDNSAIPDKVQSALYELLDFTRNSGAEAFDVNNYFSSINIIKNGIKPAFDDVIMRAKIYYTKNQVEQRELKNNELMELLEGISMKEDSIVSSFNA